MILTLENTPVELRHPAVTGVFVGGCVARGEGSRFRAKAHAHIRGEHKGWICILSAKRLTERLLLIHELSHLVYGKQFHDDGWRKVCLALGGTLDPVPGLMKSYHKKARGTVTPTIVYVGFGSRNGSKQAAVILGPSRRVGRYRARKYRAASNRLTKPLTIGKQEIKYNEPVPAAVVAKVKAALEAEKRS